MMTATPDLDHLDAQQLRELAARLMAEMRGKQALIDKLTHELAILKRLKFAASSEAYSGEQQRMLFETLDTDIEALTAEIEQLAPTRPADPASVSRTAGYAAFIMFSTSTGVR